VITREERPVGALVHDDALEDDPELVDAAVSGQRLRSSMSAWRRSS
jgi:hypothetical protein